MKENTPWNIIVKYLRKQATPEEITELDLWLKEDKENEKLLAEAFDVFAVSGSLPPPMTPDLEKAWQKINRKLTTNVHPAKLWFEKIKYTAAAVAILLIGFSTLWMVTSVKSKQILQQQTEIISPLGQKSKVLLPDSSVVWLNSGSSLKYKGNFNMKEREVVLEGEAYFEVFKNKSKKFRVKTGILNVDVYGTAFNIKNHNDDNFQEITVSEGRVGISGKTGEIRQLIRGDQAILDKRTNKIVFTQNSPEVINAWKNNELIFDNTPLEEAVKYLERWYGVQIAIDKTMMGKHNYTFKIKTESFREMLEIMKVMTPIEYEINGKEVKIRYATN
jgi:ferric-dicitrate binding protein FerR (iron transport regulator)